MKVWTLETGYYYEGSDVIGIYSSKEVVDKHSKKYMTEYKDYADREWEEESNGWCVGDHFIRIYEVEVLEE